MIQILLSYFFILYISLGMGVVFKKWIRLEKYNILFTILIGFFIQLIVSTFYAIFFPLNHLFFLINLILSSLGIVFHFSVVKQIICNTIQSFSNFSVSSKVVFLCIIIISLIHSSSLPFLTDNESYYIQTIKWLNEYGLVKGLANLHLFLGQSSGWHILQSSFNFSFITSNFNDLNGFLILLTSFFCLEKWEAYKSIENKNDLFISLTIIFLIFLFLFIASPSPDLPILLIVPIIIHLFIESFYNNNSDYINLIAVLILFIVLIKVTIAPIIILLFIALLKTKDYNNWKLFIVLSFIALFSFIVRNSIITGYPLYPISLGNEFINIDWKLNNNLQQLYYQMTSMYGWQMNNWEEFSNLSFNDKFWTWLNLPKLNGVVNKLILLLLFLFPLFKYKKKVMNYLFAYFIIQFVIFYSTSPQYRFFLPILFSISLFFSADLLHGKIKTIKFLFVLNLVLLTALGVFGLNLDGIMNNNIMNKKYPLTSSQIISPRAITQFENLEYTKHEIQNLNYFSPSQDSLFFWQTSNGPLPCTNKKMTEYFSKYYNHIPQMRTENLKDGFLSAEPK